MLPDLGSLGKLRPGTPPSGFAATSRRSSYCGAASTRRSKSKKPKRSDEGVAASLLCLLTEMSGEVVEHPRPGVGGSLGHVVL